MSSAAVLPTFVNLNDLIFQQTIRGNPAIHPTSIPSTSSNPNSHAKFTANLTPNSSSVPSLSNLPNLNSTDILYLQASRMSMTANRTLEDDKLMMQQQQQQLQIQQQQSQNDRYKTELCRPFEENGQCKYGSKCQFAHGKADLRRTSRHPKYKTELCRTFHTTGFCPYGPRCHFVHIQDVGRKAAEQQQLQQQQQQQQKMNSLNKERVEKLKLQRLDINMTHNVNNINNCTGMVKKRSASSSSSISSSNSSNSSNSCNSMNSGNSNSSSIASSPTKEELFYFNSLHLPLNRTNSLGSCSETSMSTSPSTSPALPIQDLIQLHVRQIQMLENPSSKTKVAIPLFNY